MARNPPHPHQNDLRRLLASNEGPTALEERTLRAPAVLDSEDYRAHMAPLAIQMDTGNQPYLLHEITEQRQGVNDAIRGINTALAPVRRLPVEVLGEIFLWTLKSYYPQSRTGTRAPWYLGQVCRSWRNIALSLPLLWSKIRIDEHESVHGGREWKREIEEQLARSATTPLSVFIMWPSHTPEKLAESAQLVELVVAHCERWRHLSIEAMANINELLPILAPAKGHLPQLEKLRFQLYWDPPYQSDMFMDAPKLSYVKITQQRLDCFPVPWIQIRRASIASDLWMPDPLPLTWASGLATLTLYTDIQQNRMRATGLTTLPCLGHFGGTVQGLACLVVPALQTLRLRLASNWELDIVRDFLARSQCPLRALDIRLTKNKDPTEALDMATLADILRCVPSLELLILTPFRRREPEDKHEHNSDDPTFPIEKLFSVMRLNKSTDDILPNLSIFVFGIPYNPSETNLFSEMVRSRASTQMYLPKAWKSRLQGRCGENVQWIDIDPEMFLNVSGSR